MRNILVSIELSDEWDEYFEEDVSDKLLIEDLFEELKKEGVGKIKIIDKDYGKTNK